MTLTPLLVLMVSILLFAHAVAWSHALRCWQSGKSLTPFVPRRPVPWRSPDVFVVFCTYFFVSALAMQLAANWLHFEAAANTEPSLEKLNANHPLAIVLHNAPNFWAVFVCLVAAVVVAPLSEEILFRLVLQGWLETIEPRVRRRLPALRRLTRGVFSVGMSAFLFAVLHFRSPSTEPDAAALLARLQVHIVASFAIVAAILVWLWLIDGARLTDLGIDPACLLADTKLGLQAFVMAIVPIYLVMYLIKSIVPDHIVVDPLPIFILAAVLGGLYFRTHRIVPSIVMHMAFNATGVVLALGLL